MKIKSRPSLACIPCTIRKVKCDKTIPCKNCIKRKTTHECRRRNLVPSPELPESNTDTESNLFNNRQIVHYLYSLKLLTYGRAQIKGLVPVDDLLKYNRWDQYMNQFPTLINKLTPALSRKICECACNYTTFIHQGVVNELFLKDHDNFWEVHVSKNPACLNHTSNNTLKTKSSKDYYYWMSLLYANLSTGMYFGVHEIQSDLTYTEAELSEFSAIFFRASLDCLFRAGALEHADVRCIQVFCVLSMCLHALGSTYLHKSLLRISVEAAKNLGLDQLQPDNAPDYQSEVLKRLFYSLMIIDSLSNYPKRYIADFSTPLPSIISSDVLLEKVIPGPLTFPEACKNDEIAGIMYERMMVELAQLKHESYEKPTATELVSCLEKMKVLRSKLDTYFGSEVFSPGNKSIAQYAKYLLFSSITRERLEIGIRLQSLVGTQDWAKQYRPQCLEVATQLLFHSTSTGIPAFYNRYWIVAQHLIYACLFVLLDMLLFKSDDDKYKLESVKRTFPTIKKLQSYFTVKIGFAIIEKLCYLVSKVRLDHLENETLEAISLREFLKEMEIANPYSSKFSRNRIVPDITESQYLRFGNETSHPNSTDGDFAPTEGDPLTDAENGFNVTSAMLDDKGWYEFLDFFFGGESAATMSDI
ncbi:hypothetical protein KL938_000522 [Ogataea parapolymorpha]|nr:hypothetical protein KL938_000522 [Ogataea parapolymorpha]